MSPHTNPQALSGQLIAHYRVARQLVSGGMGEVVLAEDTRRSRRLSNRSVTPEIDTRFGRVFAPSAFLRLTATGISPTSNVSLVSGRKRVILGMMIGEGG